MQLWVIQNCLTDSKLKQMGHHDKVAQDFLDLAQYQYTRVQLTPDEPMSKSQQLYKLQLLSNKDIHYPDVMAYFCLLHSEYDMEVMILI